jgi:SOS-response transcriptional repressor LexA
MFAANEQYSKSPGVPVYSDAKFGCSPGGFMGAIESSKADAHVVVPGLRNDGQTFIVRARGNSMVNRDDPEHSIPDGAYVAIQKSNLSTPQWGEVYALSTDDGCIIKRLYPSERENYVKCVSLNDKEYPCFELHSNEIHDIAIVKAVLTVSIRK